MTMARQRQPETQVAGANLRQEDPPDHGCQVVARSTRETLMKVPGVPRASRVRWRHWRFAGWGPTEQNR